MPLFVKICGLCRADDVKAVVDCGPDAIGFVFWPRSPRAVTPATAAALAAAVPPGIERVGVFVDPPETLVREAVAAAGLTVVQLHGVESPEFCRRLGLRSWKAMPASAAAADAAGYGAEAVVLDSGTADAPGGTGVVGDWDRAAEFAQACPVPVVLAGGLTPDNVATAVGRVRPWGVDVSSGVESSPGRKDPIRVREFMARCRAA